MSQVGLKLFQCIGFLPLSVLRAMGTMVGLTLYVGARWRLWVVLRQNVFDGVNSTLIITGLPLKHKVVAWVFAGKF